MKKSVQLIKTLETLKQLTETYQEIASMRMRKIKDYVLQNRDYYSPLMEAYKDVSNVYYQIYRKMYKEKTNGKTLSILLTSNTGLYGPINRGVFDSFLENESKHQNDIAIVGRLGKLWLEKSNFKRKYTYFDIEDGLTSEEAYLNQVFAFAVEYSEIKIYHGMFVSIVTQKPQITKLSRKLDSADSQNPTLPFIFEPSIEKVLDTFERQLLKSFFTQAFLESSLAKNGSRMMSLDGASINIKKNIDKSKFENLVEQHKILNKKQQEIILPFFARRNL